MKALERAAKARGEAQPAAPAGAEPASGTPPAAAPAAELTLEPLPADKPAIPEQGPRSRQPAAREQTRAATVLQAGAAAGAAAARGPHMRPITVIGIVAGVFALGFAGYVYVQIAHPGLLVRQPAPAARPPAPLTQAPASPSPLTQPQPAPTPIATETVIKPADPLTDKPATAAASGTEPPRTAQRPTSPAPAQPSAEPDTAPQRNRIQVSTGTVEPRLDPRLTQAYAALQSGKLAAAQQFYTEAARSEPQSIDALLGLAAVALQEGQSEEASRLYFRVLDLDPRNAYAQSGLIALLGRADPVSAETRLKQLIARDPSAFLHFTLGNLYADQSRWAEAQQAYFQAHHLEPGNPDYAYNLAVGLDHVGQSRLAAGFYQRAVARAGVTGRAGFNLNQAQARIRQLAAAAE